MDEISNLRGLETAVPKDPEPAVDERRQPFSSYLRALGEDPLREEECFGPFWAELNEAVTRELHRRGLWCAPPRYVGISGYQSWNREAVTDLTTECFAFVLQRLRALKAQLQAKNNVEGLVTLNIRHFLHERQKRADPLGFRIYEVVRSAVRRATDRGSLEVVFGNPEIDNGTGLGFRSAEQASPGALDLGESRTLLESRVRGWLDELLPELVTARGRRRAETEEILSNHLGGLGGEGLSTVVFKDLLDLFKGATRVRWQALWVQGLGDLALEGGEDAVPVPILLQELWVEDEDQFTALVDAVDAALEASVTGSSEDDHLRRLWDFLRSGAGDTAIEALPSRRRVAQLLGIPRYLLPQLYRRLGSVADACKVSLGRKP